MSSRLEADRLEDLRAAVGLDRRDPHLRDRLEQALGDRLDDVALRLVGGHRRRAARPSSTSSSSDSNIRYGLIARRRSRSASRSGGPRAARRTRPRGRPAGACPRARGGGAPPATASSDGIGDALGADAAVGEDEDVDAVARSPRRPRAQIALERRVEPVGALGDRPGDVERVRLEDVGVDLAQRLELLVAQDRLRRSTSWCACSGVSPSRLRSEPTLGRDAHHDRLADRVDRRVRHLREELLEVVVERAARWSESTASAGSLPIEPIGSSRVRAPSARGAPAGPPACSRTRAGASAAARSRGDARRRARAGRRGGRRPRSNHSP